MIEEKYVCPFCGFESNGAGLCPTCDKNLEKVCSCGSGKFSVECCNPEATLEEKKAEELIKAEVTSETLQELAKEDELKQKEEEELAKIEEVKEED